MKEKHTVFRYPLEVEGIALPLKVGPIVTAEEEGETDILEQLASTEPDFIIPLDIKHFPGSFADPGYTAKLEDVRQEAAGDLEIQPENVEFYTVRHTVSYSGVIPELGNIYAEQLFPNIKKAVYPSTYVLAVDGRRNPFNTVQGMTKTSRFNGLKEWLTEDEMAQVSMPDRRIASRSRVVDPEIITAVAGKLVTLDVINYETSIPFQSPRELQEYVRERYNYTLAMRELQEGFFHLVSHSVYKSLRENGIIGQETQEDFYLGVFSWLASVAFTALEKDVQQKEQYYPYYQKGREDIAAWQFIPYLVTFYNFFIKELTKYIDRDFYYDIDRVNQMESILSPTVMHELHFHLKRGLKRNKIRYDRYANLQDLINAVFDANLPEVDAVTKVYQLFEKLEKEIRQAVVMYSNRYQEVFYGSSTPERSFGDVSDVDRLKREFKKYIADTGVDYRYYPDADTL